MKNKFHGAICAEGMSKTMRKLFAVLLLLSFFVATAAYTPCKVGETIGQVISVNDYLLHVIGEPLTPSGEYGVIVNIENAPIYDLLTGFPAYISDIEDGMSVRIAYIGQTAIAVWLNCDYEDSAVFTVVVSDNIQYGSEHSVFLCTDGKYRVTLSHKTVIIDPAMGDLMPHDIVPGMEFFVWVDMITASSPALVYPNKVVLINE